MPKLSFDDLNDDLKQVLDPNKAKLFPMIAKGLAPLPPQVLVSAWSYFIQGDNPELAKTSEESLKAFPVKTLLSVAQANVADWVLEDLGVRFIDNDSLLEAVLLNPGTPNSFFIKAAQTCAERFTTLIATNEERILDCPEIVLSLEANPHNLKSSTDRLRHFLQLAGIRIPGDSRNEPVLTDEPEEKKTPDQLIAEAQKALDNDEKQATLQSNMTEAQRLNLLQYIAKLNTGAKVKLAFKGNKEARQILVRDTNSIVACAVLKSPKITEAEVGHFASQKALSDDVIRIISNNNTWVKNYFVKLPLCFHPKTPLQNSMGFIKFLTVRDLTRLTREKGIPGPLVKAAKELLRLKRQ